MTGYEKAARWEDREGWEPPPAGFLCPQRGAGRTRGPSQGPEPCHQHPPHPAPPKPAPKLLCMGWVHSVALSLVLPPSSQCGKDLGHCEFLSEGFPKLAPVLEMKGRKRSVFVLPPQQPCPTPVSIHQLAARPWQPGHRSAWTASLCVPKRAGKLFIATSAASTKHPAFPKKSGSRSCAASSPEARRCSPAFHPWDTACVVQGPWRTSNVPLNYCALPHSSRLHSKAFAMRIFRSTHLPPLYLQLFLI